MDYKARVSRRDFLKGVGTAAAAATLAACTVPTPTPAPTEAPEPQSSAGEGFDWKKYSGAEIRLLTQDNHIWAEVVQEKKAEFEEFTGITLNIDLQPDVRKQTSLEFSTGSSTADVFATQPPTERIKYTAAGYYTDLRPLVEDPSLSSPELNFADFPQKILDTAIEGDILFGIPIWSGGSMLCYHKPLLEKAGVTTDPNQWTFDDMMEAAAKIDALGDDIYGIALRGAAVQAAGIFSPWLKGFGGDWLDAGGNPALATPEALAAFEAYGTALREYGPLDATTLNWSKAREFLLNDKAGIWYDVGVLMPLDPEEFAPVDRFGFAVTPAGPTGIRSPQLSSWALAVYSGSDNKEAAWLFIQWSTSPEFQLAVSERGVLPSRSSVFQMPEFKSGIAASNPDYIAAIEHALANGHGDWLPPFVNVLEARDVVGQVIQKAINGATGDELLEQAEWVNGELTRIRQESGL
jgi:multiple sugar transport system substrate-binding protein